MKERIQGILRVPIEVFELIFDNQVKLRPLGRVREYEEHLIEFQKRKIQIEIKKSFRY